MATEEMIICEECGVPNRPGSPFCRACGSALNCSGAGGRESRGEESARVLILKEKTTGRELRADSPGAVIGRDEKFGREIFAGNLKVSSPHCRIFLDGDKWKVSEFKEHPSCNRTYIIRRQGERPIRVHDTPLPLFDLSELYVADICFEVRIPRPYPKDNDAQQKTPPETGAEQNAQAEERAEENKPCEPVTYEIVCPVCGTAFPVSGPDERIAECKSCPDPFDRREIARVRPTPKR